MDQEQKKLKEENVELRRQLKRLDGMFGRALQKNADAEAKILWYEAEVAELKQELAATQETETEKEE